MKRIIQIIFLIMSLLFLFGCGEEEPETEPLPPEISETSKPKASARPSADSAEDAPEEETYDIINPLTGEATDGDISHIRPYAIMLNNLKAALPQHGVSEADIIYELLAEGGITRMLAIFTDVSDAGIIGSIRSARPYYVDIAEAHDALYIHAGGSPQAYTLMWNSGIVSIDGVNGGIGLDIFYRDNDRLRRAGYEHSLFTSGELIGEVIPELGLRLEHGEDYEYIMSFDSDAAPDGEDCLSLTAYFTGSSSTAFDFDEDTGLYMVSEYGSEFVDGNTDEQLGVTNLIILHTDVYTIRGDSEGRLTTRTTGTGTGYFVCGGAVAEIEWSREAEEQFFYTLAGGGELTLGRGTSYVCVLPNEGWIEYE